MTNHIDTQRAWVATRKGLFELARGKRGSWDIVGHSFKGDPVTALLPPSKPSAPMLAALNLGHFGSKLQRSDDQGKTWQEVATPTYPASADGVSLIQIWTLERGAGGAAGDASVWAGTLPGGLFRSNDQGASWQRIDSLWNRPERAEWFGGGNEAPGMHSVLPHPKRADEVMVGISCGGVWKSTDDAATWTLSAKGLKATYLPPDMVDSENTQDPHRIARCAAVPDVLWCQHHCGMWRSTDNGATWVKLANVPVSDFGFAVAAHPTDSLTAWFVPAESDQRRVPIDGALCVLRTRDGGASFEVLREGLPQAHCFDLIYRHALDVTADGSSLMMGSTTGALWTSDNGGATWQLINAHLPPIYAVRFG